MELPKGKVRRSASYNKRANKNKESCSNNKCVSKKHSLFSSIDTVVLENQADIYRLNLNQSGKIGQYHGIYTRVPGGWTYTDGSGCCFIPYNDEFINNLN